MKKYHAIIEVDEECNIHVMREQSDATDIFDEMENDQIEDLEEGTYSIYVWRGTGEWYYSTPQPITPEMLEDETK
jgi:hypothetical protein